jgi:hypothetical protein
LTATGRRAARNPWVRVGARVGLGSRGIVWGLMGVLALNIAAGGTRRQADQQGALAAVAAQSGGWLLLVLLAAGLGSYALWRLSQAVVGTSAQGTDVRTRLTDVVRAVSYGFLCSTALSVALGSSGKSQDKQEQSVSARVMSHTGGRWLVGVVGLVVVAAGGYFAWQGVRKDIFEHLDPNDVPKPLRAAAVVIGVVGNTARGVVIALAGVLAIAAAITASPKKTTGLDGALRTVAQQAYGPWLIGAAGVGLIAFGLFGLAEGIWSKV